MAESRRAYEARKIRNRARRSLAALERDVAAGTVSKSFASARRGALERVISENTWSRESGGWTVKSVKSAVSRAEKVFETYSASISREFNRGDAEARREAVKVLKERSFRNDLESALRGELSLEKTELAEAFLKSTRDVWAGLPPEERLDAIARTLGTNREGKSSLRLAYNRWRRETRDGEDFFTTSRESIYSQVDAIWRKFGKTSKARQRLEKLFGDE